MLFSFLTIAFAVNGFTLHIDLHKNIQSILYQANSDCLRQA